jgi:hypothetical protein
MSKIIKSQQSQPLWFSSCRKPYMVFGTIILLSSFVSQQFLLDRYENRLKTISDATEMYSRVNVSSLQYLAIYYSSRAAGAEDSPEILKKAAKENSIGNLIFIFSTPLQPDERKQCLDRLDKAVSSVNDLDSYNAYVTFLNTMEKELYPKRFAEERHLRSATEIAQWAYLAPYFLGTFLLVVGFWRGE